MNRHVSKITEDVNQRLETIELEENTSLRKAKKAIAILKEIMQQLKIRLSDYKFKNEEEEICFFKEFKPQLSSKLVYYSEIYKPEFRLKISYPPPISRDKTNPVNKQSSLTNNFLELQRVSKTERVEPYLAQNQA